MCVYPHTECLLSGEAGGISQHIGATMLPRETIRSMSENVEEDALEVITLVVEWEISLLLVSFLSLAEIIR